MLPSLPLSLLLLLLLSQKQLPWCRCQACHQSINCWLTATLQKPCVIFSHHSRRRSSCIQLSPCKASQTAIKLSYLWYNLELMLPPRSVIAILRLIVCLFSCLIFCLLARSIVHACMHPFIDACMHAVDILMHTCFIHPLLPFIASLVLEMISRSSRRFPNQQASDTGGVISLVSCVCN